MEIIQKKYETLEQKIKYEGTVINISKDYRFSMEEFDKFMEDIYRESDFDEILILSSNAFFESMKNHFDIAVPFSVKPSFGILKKEEYTNSYVIDIHFRRGGKDFYVVNKNIKYTAIVPFKKKLDCKNSILLSEEVDATNSYTKPNKFK